MDEYTDINKYFTEKRYEYYLSMIQNPKSILEIGVGDLTSTRYLYENVPDGVTVHAVDPDPPPGTNPFDPYVFPNTAQEFVKYNQRYDLVILSHVLEHVELDEASEIINAAYELTLPGGHLIIDVPNANSLHRRVGVDMGILPNIFSLNDEDIRLGHKRVWGSTEFKDFCSDNLLSNPQTDRLIFGGTQLKVQPNSELKEKLSTEEGRKYLDSLFSIGRLFPSFAADIYCVVEKV